MLPIVDFDERLGGKVGRIYAKELGKYCGAAIIWRGGMVGGGAIRRQVVFQ
jgi:hypothetical protein